MKNQIVCENLDQFYKIFREAYDEFMKNEVETFKILCELEEDMMMGSDQKVEFFKSREIIAYSIDIEDTGIDTGTEINIIYANRRNKFFKCFKFAILDSFNSDLKSYLLSSHSQKMVD